MKTFKAMALAAFVAIALTACNNVEKILPKKDGRWDVSRVEAKTYFSGVLASDTVITDGNGFMVFNSDGTGYTEDENGTKDAGSDFTWTADDDKISVTDSSGTLTSDVLEASKKELMLSLTVEESTILGDIRVETISTLNRVD